MSETVIVPEGCWLCVRYYEHDDVEASGDVRTIKDITETWGLMNENIEGFYLCDPERGECKCINEEVAREWFIWLDETGEVPYVLKDPIPWWAQNTEAFTKVWEPIAAEWMKEGW